MTNEGYHLGWAFAVLLCPGLAAAGPLADALAEVQRGTDAPSLAAELAQRVAVDQRGRQHLGPGEIDQALLEDLAVVDRANAARMAEILDEGWPTRTAHGNEAARHAWLLIQHADHDVALQQRALAAMAALVPRGEASARHLAYLDDRVAVNTDQPQRYGTQGTCAPDRMWTPRPLADPDRVDALRAEVGLEPLGHYQALFDCQGLRAEADAAYASGDHSACAASYTQFAEAREGPHAATAWYNAACCASLAGDTAAAWSSLEHAVGENFDDWLLVEEDTDLAGLRRSEAWPAWIADHRGRVRVRVDPRVELLHLVFWLAELDEFTTAPREQPYLTQARALLGAHADHEVVQLARGLRQARGVGYNAVSALGFMLDELHCGEPGGGCGPVQLRVSVEPLPDGVDERLASDLVPTFVAALDRFAQDADLAAYRAQTRRWRTQVSEQIADAVASESPQTWFDTAFPGAERSSLLVVPDVVSWQNNYAGWMRLSDGSVERYVVIGSLPWDTSSIPAGLGDQVGILVHEMAHAYGNPWVDRQMAALGTPGKKLFKRVRTPMRRQAYSDAQVMLGESLTRAITQLYMRDRHGELAAARDLLSNARQHFTWIADLADVLAGHRHDDGHIDLDAATADIAQVLHTWARARDEQRFRAPLLTINGAFEQSESPTISVADHPELRAYVTKVRDQFWAGVEVDGVVNRGPARLYGSPSSHPTIARILHDAGIVVAPDGITLSDGQHIEGERLQLAVVLELEGHPVVVYTAHEDADVVGIHSLFHGPHTATIGRAGEVTLQTDLMRTASTAR